MIKRTIQSVWGYLRLYGVRALTRAVLRRAKRYIKARVRSGPPSGSPHLYTIVPQLDRVEPPSRSARAVIRKPLVAVIGDLNLPQCKKYRVLQKQEALDSLGVTCEYCHWEDAPRALDLLQISSFVIFYRTQSTGPFRIYLDECTRLRVPTAYDIDDPIFSKAIYSTNPNLHHLHPAEAKNLLASSDRHLHALQACDYAIVSTPRLAKEVHKLGHQEAFLWRNAIDRETLYAAQLANGRPSGRQNSSVSLVYASGSRAHEADFREIESVMLQLLSEFPELRFSVVGFLDLPKTFARFRDRISIKPFSDYNEYIAELRSSDVAVIPLVPDAFNDCKSAIRQMEAAIVAVPSVASRIGDFANVVVHGENGMLASTTDDWYQHLRALVSDAERRHIMGAAAREKELRELTVQAIAQTLPEQLQDLIHGR